ncbi:TetR family transcriptional regulator [Salinicoccus carnicancri]|uniref:TetR family transcriptional regulator n=1 Tax=Salinicoccus carnicancri TaxID=558170 RepID=UPI0002D5A473|nr:TetR family transcriptional regulator [Salinicoccus carnicancri]
MDKRQRIIDSAIKLYLRQGIEKTTITDIVKDAGIGQGTYYLYFSSKLSVMPAIAEDMVNKVLSRLENEVREHSFEKNVEAMVSVFFDNTAEYKELTKLVYTGFTQTEEIGRWETIYAPLYEWVQRLLEHAHAEGEIKPVTNTFFTARIVTGAMESAAEQVYLFDDPEQSFIDEYRSALVYYILTSLNYRQ